MEDAGPTTLETIAAIGSIVTPFLIAIFSGVILMFQRRADAAQRREEAQRDRAQRLEEGMRADRIQIYNEVLKPFIMIFGEVKQESAPGSRRRSKPGRQNQQREAMDAGEIMRSTDYRDAAFKLSLFASDGVVKAFNDLMQFAYQAESSEAHTDSASESTNANTLDMLHKFGTFLLRIRQSVGNEETTLSDVEMLEWLISDLRSVIAAIEADEPTAPPPPSVV